MPHSKSAISRVPTLLVALISSILSPVLSHAAIVNLNGSFTHDNDVQLFDFTVTTPGSVDLRSYGYGGGSVPNHSGISVVAAGGFDTILTLFDASGSFLLGNDDGTEAAIDPATGISADARITANLAMGSYILALTQYDSFWNGDLADGFAGDANPTFTADPGFTVGSACPGNTFRDISGSAGQCRTGNWYVNFSNVAMVTPVAPTPEPGTLVLLSAGLLGLALVRSKRRRALPLVGLWLGGCLVAVHAQQSPDYSKVQDYLNGNRTLLQKQDIVISAYQTRTGDPGTLNSYKVATGVINTTNGVTTGQSVRVDNQNYLENDDRILHAFAGRVYASAHDQYLSVIPTLDAPYILMQDGAVSTILPPFPSVAEKSNFTTFSGAMADFNGDGYADLVVNFGPGDETGKMVVFSGADANGTFSARYGPVSAPQETLLAMTTGDFYGDGRQEMAGLAYKRNGQYTLCIYAVDPATLAVSKIAEITPDYSAEGSFSSLPFYSLTAGKLTAKTNQQLVYAYSTGTGHNTKIAVFDFTNSGTALSVQQLTTFDASSQPNSSGDIIQVQAARFDPSSNVDLITFLFAWQFIAKDIGVGTKYIRTLSLGLDGDLTANPVTDFSNACAVSRMTIGNFDKNLLIAGKVQPALTKQIAFIATDCSSDNRLFFLGVAADGKSFTADQEGYGVPTNISSLGSLSIVGGDIQGRSYVLGTPIKVVLTNAVQPSAIIAAPPMHIDFMSPQPRNNVPQKVLNLTGAPDGFFTKYSTQDSSNSTATTTSDNSWSFSAKEQIGASLEIGSVKKGDGTRFSDTFTASQQLTHTYGQTHGSYTSYNFGVTQQSGVDDQVWYKQSRFNIWVYPVLGKTVCPASKSPCGPSDMVPLNVQFSGPDQIESGNVTGNLLSWYQPPWEPFNILSYPANYSQLQLIVPDIAKLSTDTHFFTDNSATTVTSTWEVGSNTQKSTGYDQTYSEDNDTSLVGSASYFGVVTVGASLDVDLGGSNSFHDLTQGATTLSKSAGIAVTKPSSFMDPLRFGYDVVPYIFGRQSPGGLVNGTPLSTDIATFGLLQTAFSADPTVMNAGSWWIQAYGQKPDVAVNHPARWGFTQVPQRNPAPDGCLPVGTGNQMDCATPSQYSPAQPWDSEFQFLRGFFISDAKHPGQGPLLKTAKPGTVLSLQTRVYNYSLKAMEPATKVHVRFYAQPWDQTNQAPLPGNPSFLVGEQILGPVAPFNGANGAPLNWVLANTTFDTTSYENKYFTFWVVVWMEDASGKLVPEIDQHGLQAKPGTLTALTDLSEESFGNNVGFFKLAFYVLPKEVGAAVSTESQVGLLNLSKVNVPASVLSPGQRMTISAVLTTQLAPVAGPSVLFYDGDPKAGGKVFGFDQAAFVRLTDNYRVSAVFKANTCGSHQLFVVVDQGKPTEISRRAAPVQVKCN